MLRDIADPVAVIREYAQQSQALHVIAGVEAAVGICPLRRDGMVTFFPCANHMRGDTCPLCGVFNRVLNFHWTLSGQNIDKKQELSE